MTRRQRIVRAFVLGLSATIVGRLLAACGGVTTTSPSSSASVAPKTGGTLKLGTASPVVALD